MSTFLADIEKRNATVFGSNTFAILQDLRKFCTDSGLEFSVYTACGPNLGSLAQVKLPGEGKWPTDHIFGCYLDHYDGMFILGTSDIEGFDRAQTSIRERLKNLGAKYEARPSWWCIGSGKDCHAVDVTELCIFPKGTNA